MKKQDLRIEEFEDSCIEFINNLMIYRYGECSEKALNGVMSEVHSVVDCCRATIRGDIAIGKLIERTIKHEH